MASRITELNHHQYSQERGFQFRRNLVNGPAGTRPIQRRHAIHPRIPLEGKMEPQSLSQRLQQNQEQQVTAQAAAN